MFPKPVEHKDFEHVSRLPDGLRIGRSSAWADLNLGGRELDAFLEGPVCDDGGNLYVTDIPFGRILRMTRDGSWDVMAEYDGWPNGMKLRANGNFLVADHKLGLLEIAHETGAVEVLCDGYQGNKFYGLNDLTESSDGDIYFTDQGQSGLQAPYGRVFCLGGDGNLRLLMDNIPSPNGLVLSRDERTLFLAVTRTNAIWRLPLSADGSVYKAGVFIQMSGGIGPDGIARVDDTDALMAAHPGIGLWAFGDDGLPIGLWRSPEFLYPTNLTANQADPGSYFVTESLEAVILRVRVP